jgi:lysophospholipase L1-like esterase
VIIADLRVCFIGDSFVAGYGDGEQLGWVGRVAARSAREGQRFTVYNLGVRGHTSTDVVQRWRQECTPRLPAHCERRIVASFGVNDTIDEDGRARVALSASADNLARLLTETRDDFTVLVVGPPPVDDTAQNERTAALNERYATICRDHNVDYVEAFPTLHTDRCWMDEVAADDGAHPGTAGYQQLANLIYPRFTTWIASATGSGDRRRG